MAIQSRVNVADLSSDLRLDAEFYQPAFLRQSEIISNLRHAELSEIADVSDGNHLAISEIFVAEGVRYLRGQDLKDFFISDDAPVFIPESEYKKLARSHIFPGDVLVGIVGTIGGVGLVTGRFEKVTGNCKLAIVRSSEIEPEYLAAYFASEPGQNEILRRVRGTVQMGVILPDLRELPIPLLTSSQRRRPVELVRKSYRQRTQAIGLYQQIEKILSYPSSSYLRNLISRLNTH